jgi:CelD/BcsL family acetyltransferase involved in cellulose biosynthesis
MSAEMTSLRAEWTALGEAVGNPFATWEWLNLWWRHFGRSDRALRLVSAHHADRGLVGVVALYRLPAPGLRVLRYVGHGPSDELGPVVPQGSLLSGPELLRRALDLCGGWDVLFGEDMAAGAWTEHLDGQLHRHVSSPVLDLDGASWPDLLSGKSSHFRQWVRRAERNLARVHRVNYRLVTQAATLDSDFATLRRLHTARWGGATPFADSRMQAFQLDFARVALARGWLRLWFLELDGGPVAAWYGLRFAGQEWSYQMGRDPRYDKLNVGFVLNNHSLREAVGDGVRGYQFLRGSDSYKLRWATRDPGLDTVLAARGPVGRAAVMAAGRARVLAPQARRIVRRVTAGGLGGAAGAPTTE